MSLRERYPKLMDGLEDIEELRHLLVIDENYDDVDSDEFDVFDPSEYNYMIYITEVLQERLGKEKIALLIERLGKCDTFEIFYAHEDDIYGVMTPLNDEAIAGVILDVIEEILS